MLMKKVHGDTPSLSYPDCYHGHSSISIFSTMNPNLTEIAYILDRSGSMEPLREAAVAGFNDFLKHQLDVPGDARLTLVLFDDEYLVPVAAMPLEEVPQLNAQTYLPRGSTALLDAIGETIDALGRRLADTPEPDRPGKVIVIVFTDGLENASHRCTWEDIAARIRRQRDQYAWEFIFLGANQDAIATASQMNVGAVFTSGVASTAAGITGANLATGRKVSSLRRSTMGIHTADADAPMSELVTEETNAAESRERKGKSTSTKSPKPSSADEEKSA